MTVSTRRRFLITSSMIIFIMGLIIVPFLSEPAMSFSNAAPAGYCGAPGDGNSDCSSCHVGPPATIITGAITTDIPATGYIPGTTYNVSAKIVRPGHVRFGFQVSPQDLSGNLIGSMNDLGAETSFTGFGKYITHSSTGTAGVDSVTWLFEWVAPISGTGSFTFYGAFNVTDNSGGNAGDTVYLSTLSYTEDITASIASAQNPFYGLTVSTLRPDQIGLSFQMTEAARVIVSLYDLQGKFLGEIYNDFNESKSFNEKLILPSFYSPGILMMKIQAGNNQRTEKILTGIL